MECINLKVAIDYQSTQGKKTGIGVAAKFLVEEIIRQRPGWDIDLYTSTSEKDFNTPKRIFWESIQIPIRALFSKPDIVYSPGFAPARFTTSSTLVTVHDIIGMLYPQNLPPVARYYWSKWLPACIKKSKHVVASSESTKRDIVKFLGKDPETIRVIPLAANPVYELPQKNKDIAQKYGLSKPFFVTVGTIEPRKNLIQLVKAVSHLLRQGNDSFQVAVVGKGGGQEEVVKNLVKENGLDNVIRFLGYVPDEEIRDLYYSSIGYAIVSMYEGFGLPVLEAMSCGKTGIVSNVSSLPEVAGDSAIMIDPGDENDIARGLMRIIKEEDFRERLERRSLQMSSNFSWEKTASEMIEVMESMV